MRAATWLLDFTEACSKSCAQQRITFHRKLDPILGNLVLDSSLLDFGIAEVLKTAIAFVGDGGALTLTLTVAANQLRLSLLCRDIRDQLEHAENLFAAAVFAVSKRTGAKLNLYNTQVYFLAADAALTAYPSDKGWIFDLAIPVAYPGT